MTSAPGHRRSLRVPGYDYSQPGAYFITVCTYGREPLLGKIGDGVMRLSEAERIVRDCWEGLPARYPGLELDVFVIMPNHFHGILIIADQVPSPDEAIVRPGSAAVGAIHELPLPQHIQRRCMVLPKAVGFFKMNAAKRINQLRGTPGLPVWQRNYYERVIRNERELGAVRKYMP